MKFSEQAVLGGSPCVNLHRHLKLYTFLGVCRYWCNVRIYAAQVLLALEHIHGLGYIYCDLKPENLLVCTDGSVKISDLGLAAQMPEDGKKLFRVCGTSEYMSPEMICRKGYGFMTDIWSYGIFIYELLTCITPFQAMVRIQSGLGVLPGFQIRIHTHTHLDLRNILQKLNRLGIGPRFMQSATETVLSSYLGIVLILGYECS